jgi:N-formylglutamate deformylase
MAELWTLRPGDAPLIVNVPHAGVHIPDDIHARLTAVAKELPDTDWYVDRLYEFAVDSGVTLMSATHSRIVVDLNRDPAGDALYPGASNTEICPTTTFHRQEIYLPGCAPNAAEIDARVKTYWQPYHRQLAAEVERIRNLHGYCMLLDGHSIVSVVPRFFDGRLPDFNLGTADGASCEEVLAARTFELLSAAPGFSSVHNGRFKGGYITRHYGKPEKNVHALQLEMAQCAYMCETLSETRPVPFDPQAAARLTSVLQQLVESLLQWRPQLVSIREKQHHRK